jgi:hypothetical protein
MAIKQNTKRCVGSFREDQRSAGRSRKSIKHRPVGRLEEPCDGPLNVLGCLALIHAIRSIN